MAQLITFLLDNQEHAARREDDVRALEDIIAVAGHDLRQPLTALYGRGQLLLRRAKTAALAEELLPGLETMVAQTRRAIVLSDQLLDIARIESGEFSIHREPFDLTALVQQTLEDVRITFPRHVFVGTMPTIVFNGDQGRMGQVIRNLLENAAKYSPADSGSIVLSAATVPHDPPTLHIQVRDNGLGVQEDELARLFERKYRATSATSSGITGTGLGLYVTKQIVEAHGGSIWAEQNHPDGLAVHLMLPVV